MMKQTLASIAIVILVLIALVPSGLAVDLGSNVPPEDSAIEHLGNAVLQQNETQIEELTTDLASTEPQETNEVSVAATQITSTGFYYPTDCHEYWNNAPGWLADGDENYVYSNHYHAGVDIYAPAGSNVYSIGDGEVVYIGEGWDSTVEDLQGIYIKHCTDEGQPFVSVYGHVRDDVDGIAVGQTVTAGQIIGHVGRFDRTNGEPYGAAHVHFVISVSSDTSAPGCGDILLTQHQAHALVDPLNWIDSVSPGTYPAIIAYDPEIVVTEELSITQTGNTLTATFTIQNNGAEEVTLKELYVSGRYKYVSSTSGTLPSGEYPDFIKVKDLTLQPSATYTYTSCYVIPYTGDYEFFVMTVDSNDEKCWLIPKNDGTISSRWFYANLFGTGSAVRSNPASISPGTTVPPGTGATVTPTLSWQSVTGAGGYRVFISECDEKGSVTSAVIYRYPEIGGEPIQGTSFANIPEGILQPGRYYCWNFEPMVNGEWNQQYSTIKFFRTVSETLEPVHGEVYVRSGASPVVADGSVNYPYPTIQRAISNLVRGDVINVWGESGIYYEGGFNISVPDVTVKMWEGSPDKPLIINSSHIAPAITITADNVRLENLDISDNLRIREGDTYFYVYGETPGVYIVGTQESPLDRFTITGCTFSRNNASYCFTSGGALSVRYANNGVIRQTLFTDNIVSGNGAGMGIYHSDNTTIDSVLFSNNIPGQNGASGGGACIIASNYTSILNSTFCGNRGAGGGGLDFGGSRFTNVENSTFIGNTANGGAGIYFDGSPVAVITNSSFVGNIGYLGAAVSLWYADSVTIANSSFSNNHGGQGGAVCIRYSNMFTLNDSMLVGNTAESSGDGLYFCESRHATITNNLFNNENNIDAASGSYVKSSSGILNRTLTYGTNIVGGPCLGGNVWAKPDGTGFSQNAIDSDNNGICDEKYCSPIGTDYLPLVHRGVSIVPKTGIPKLLTPENESSIKDTTPTFTWSPVLGADYYSIEINDADWGEFWFLSNHICGNSFTLPDASALWPKHNYTWAMRAFNTTLGWSEESAYFYFTVDEYQPQNIEWLNVKDECGAYICKFDHPSSTYLGIDSSFDFSQTTHLSYPNHLQKVLNANPQTQVADTGTGSPECESNVFGSKTKAALIKFQEVYDLPVQNSDDLGTVDQINSETKDRLNAVLNTLQHNPIKLVPKNWILKCLDSEVNGYYFVEDVTDGIKGYVEKESVTVTTDHENVKHVLYINPPADFQFENELKSGDNSVEVKYLQSILDTYGYFGRSYELTGYFGTYTYNCLVDFQADHGLERTGIVDPATRQVLNDLLENDIADIDRPQAIINEVESNIEEYFSGSFSRDVILAMIAQESGGAQIRYDNAHVAKNPWGRGIMMVDTDYYVGKESGIRYWKDGNVTYGREDASVTPHFYTNTVQGIAANIKDGFGAIREKYNGALKQVTEVPDDLAMEGYTLEELRWICTAYRYNGGYGYVSRISEKLESLNQYYEHIDPNKSLAQKFKISHETYIKLRSPGYLQITDSSGRVTGFIDGHHSEEIPYSFFDQENHCIWIPFVLDHYDYRVVGTGSGHYGLSIMSRNGNNESSFGATGILISANDTHDFAIDWDALDRGEDGVTINIDKQGDGSVEETIASNQTWQPVTASFEADVTVGPKPLRVSFTDRSSGEPTNWTWSFGDENTSDEQNPTNVYQDYGLYNVTLTVSNERGCDTLTRIAYINVTSQDLVANFLGVLTEGPAPLTVQFNDTSIGTPVSWNWTFGDSNTSTEQNPIHTYTTPGNYSVALTVSNGNANDTVTKEHYILVKSVVSPEITLSRGWNFISVPKTLSASNNNASTLFSSVDTGEKSILAYNTQTKTWTSITEEDIIQPLNGYWIYAAAETAIDLTYPSTSTSLPEKTLYPGWNAVGLSSGENTTADNALACLGSSWKTVIPWNLEGGMYDPAIINGGTGTYSPDRLMTLGNGYWVYVDTESTVIGLTA